tara:strand:+ start:467 stop:568 length:102 start_codon:yes stop_codon:yes gene_type:complete
MTPAFITYLKSKRRRMSRLIKQKEHALQYKVTD